MLQTRAVTLELPPTVPAFVLGPSARAPKAQARQRRCRTHWIAVDEAHHMLPEHTRPLVHVVEQLPESALLVTVHPDRLATRPGSITWAATTTRPGSATR